MQAGVSRASYLKHAIGTTTEREQRAQSRLASFPGSHSCSGAGESPETRLRVGVAVYCSCKHQDEANFFVDVASASWTGCWPYLLQSSGLSAPRESTRQVG